RPLRLQRQNRSTRPQLRIVRMRRDHQVVQFARHLDFEPFSVYYFPNLVIGQAEEAGWDGLPLYNLSHGQEAQRISGSCQDGNRQSGGSALSVVNASGQGPANPCRPDAPPQGWGPGFL